VFKRVGYEATDSQVHAWPDFHMYMTDQKCHTIGAVFGSIRTIKPLTVLPDDMTYEQDHASVIS